ncbi:hypothetical protein Acr_00g0077810 [Actinidia rufa]|uniref:CCHC-type domain-containing protein n=1 Tax=Actinidia rufa TaxID=165716 RepID=A0A7J0DTC5_9ERIC|nr:hypothetical protein Acr_00g0077810 [Actinidia rufa]
MGDTRGSGQESGNDNPQMTELRDMMHMLVGAGLTSRCKGVTEDPAIPMKSVTVAQQFLKLKLPTFKGRMDPIKANDWILAMEKKFRLLKCGEQQKVEIGSYLLAGKTSRWWILKGVKEPGMNWARFKVIFREKYVPRAVQNAKCLEFATDEMRARRFKEGLRHEIRKAIRPLVLPTYADVLDKAIIVEQDETERKKYFDNKRRQNLVYPKCGRYHWGKCWKDKTEVTNEIRCFHCNEVGHIKRNCPRLRAEIVAQRGGPLGGNREASRECKARGYWPGNPGNRGRNVNN